MAYARTLLGSVCTKCGSTKKLHTHHTDPKGKYLNVSSMASKYSNERFEAEIAKCVLLCERCHNSLTAREHRTGGRNKWTSIQHGKIWAYTRYGCRCPLCKEAKRLSR